MGPIVTADRKTFRHFNDNELDSTRDWIEAGDLSFSPYNVLLWQSEKSMFGEPHLT